ncbi:hypothetical protein SARC_10085 [Sphaeroforma arctica JP610]|uniref:Uncharacterized protein n=1 Tax=Sphaeroforma arctica JP610 TaxID=667725 RepID=A0A0L0FLU2_9EUKA|nr:hypothetical protein SARC_10085 [Sphaeroforma arctica JP610]KNC77451.1 hypothetical protein SARC_10085 [Sphaeroforma arctica JP610]|eukprot:XP_014151353.1 hypothetical protein SARC_10085 [Sphaeroforma arctica JP610]
MLDEQAGGEHPHVELFDYQDLQLYLPEYLEEDNGYVGDVKRRTVREITDYQIWRQAWKNYIVGLLMHRESLRGELKVYEHKIREYNNQFSWCTVYNYDMEFRTLVMEGKVQSFTHVNVELYEKWFIIPQGRVQRTLDSIKNRKLPAHVFTVADIPEALGISRQRGWVIWVVADTLHRIDDTLNGCLVQKMLKVPMLRTLWLSHEKSRIGIRA